MTVAMAFPYSVALHPSYMKMEITMKHTSTCLQVMLLALVCWNTAVAEEEFQDIEIETIQAGDGFITSEKFVEMLYQDLSRQNPAG